MTRTEIEEIINQYPEGTWFYHLSIIDETTFYSLIRNIVFQENSELPFQGEEYWISSKNLSPVRYSKVSTSRLENTIEFRVATEDEIQKFILKENLKEHNSLNEIYPLYDTKRNIRK